MERAPLRPVPARPAGPVDPAAAIQEAGATLPALTPLETRAFALVALADRPRPQVAELLGIDPQEIGALLAAARKELRQTITPLPGSGWCERAEALISDRLDGAMPERDARRLDVHLRNCPRCVEHERRLVQATDALLAGVAPLAPRPGPTLPPTELAPAEVAPTELSPAELAPVPEDAALTGAADASAPAPDAAAPAPGSPASVVPPSPDQVAAAAEVLVTARTRRQLAAAVTWNAMIAIALILTIASIAAIIAGILGAQL
jgi:hypothetical protein